MEDVKEEICLVANIIDKLLDSNESLRADQLVPLTKRLRNAANAITVAEGTRCANTAPLSPLFRAARSKDTGLVAAKPTGSRYNKKAQGTFGSSRSSAGRKVTSQSLSPNSTLGFTETPQLHISSDVSRALCCSLYNILESTVSLLRASHGHIFVKKGDEIASIANVSRKLIFPPQQIHHRCTGNADAEVLGSSIALNRFTEDVGKKSALLIFPIFGRGASLSQSRDPVATIHVERKEYMFEPFNYDDECILYFASMFCAELMSRVPHLDWLSSFYDPGTQHIVAPFVPFKPVTLPAIRRAPSTSGSGTEALNTGNGASPSLVSTLAQKVDAHGSEVLIRRETLPSTSSKPFASGIAHMPTLLEIQAYVDNLQSCWRKNLTANVDLLESNRSTQQDLKVARSELLTVKRQLAAAKEKLRLYELESKDYKYEYCALKTELNTYMNKLERLH